MSIRAIRLAIEAIIIATTPDFMPAIPYRLAPKDRALEDIDPSTSPLDDTRLFRVVTRPGTRFGEWDGNLSHLIKTIHVEILYRVPRLDDGYERMRDMATTDEDRIAHELNKPDWAVSPWDGTTIENIEVIDNATLVPVDDQNDRHILTIEFEADYNLGDN